MASLLAASAAKRRLPILMSFYARLSSTPSYCELSYEQRNNLGETRKVYGAPPEDLENREPSRYKAGRPFLDDIDGYFCISETKCNEPEIKVVSELLTAKASPGKEKLQQDDTIPSPVPISDGQIPDPCISETKCYNEPKRQSVSQLMELWIAKGKLQQDLDDTIPSPMPISGDNKPEIKVVSELWSAKLSLSPRKEKLQQDDTIPSPVPISEMEHQPSNANQATETKHQPSKNANQANGKKSSRRDEDGAKKRERASLINALERNNELLRAQLEDQKSSFQLAREEHKEQHERLVAALTKITGALEKVADKL